MKATKWKYATDTRTEKRHQIPRNESGKFRVQKWRRELSTQSDGLWIIWRSNPIQTIQQSPCLLVSSVVNVGKILKKAAKQETKQISFSKYYKSQHSR